MKLILVMYIFYLFNNNNTFSNLLIKVGIKLNTIYPSETKMKGGDLILSMWNQLDCCNLLIAVISYEELIIVPSLVLEHISSEKSCQCKGDGKSL